MRVAVFGLGYVGLTSVGCLTKSGHSVFGVDLSEEKIAQLKRGHTPIVEPGLADLIREAWETGAFDCATSADGRLDACDMAIVCVGTPSGTDGSHDLRYLIDVTKQLAEGISESRPTPLTVVYRSTMAPGTMEEVIAPTLEDALGPAIDKVELVYNPEFMREASAVADYFNPPKIVIGAAGGRRSARMEELYCGFEAPLFYAPLREAEITKLVDNTFHALKVAFANELARICLLFDVDPQKMHEIFVADTKSNISPRYLKPGGAFGGSCLPKDVRAMQHLAADVGAETSIINALIQSNEAHKRFVFERCTQGTAPGAKVLLVGLAFKAGIDDMRESQNLDMATRLLRAGYEVSILDPSIEPEKLIGKNLGYAMRHFPSLSELLISVEDAQRRTWDLVVDANGEGRRLKLATRRLAQVNALSEPQLRRIEEEVAC